jgi:hypothetical protein
MPVTPLVTEELPIEELPIALPLLPAVELQTPLSTDETRVTSIGTSVAGFPFWHVSGGGDVDTCGNDDGIVKVESVDPGVVKTEIDVFGIEAVIGGTELVGIVKIEVVLGCPVGGIEDIRLVPTVSVLPIVSHSDELNPGT